MLMITLMSPEKIVGIFKFEVFWLFQDKDEHLELMDGTLVDLLHAKWNAFVKFRYILKRFIKRVGKWYLHVQGVPLPTKPGSSLIILLQAHSDTYRHNFTTNTFLFISHTTNVLLFKSRCNIFIGFGIIKELPDLVGSGTFYIWLELILTSCYILQHNLKPTDITIL